MVVSATTTSVKTNMLMLNKKGAITMKTFEPSAKAIALREYQEAWTAFC